ncbi:hypothetical protein [Chryseobacterium sp.]|uniref:hypothetical protein n=1 Tax=Chryseobacterium sp. TaxID=1871047 RepID=UPI00263176A2|nr:hypothetical protein [Chryseobacterium sp.]
MNNNEREIPGMTPFEWKEFRYVSDDGSNEFLSKKDLLKEKGLFERLTEQINPPVPIDGGALTENCRLWLPSGELLHALSYRGDIEGWRMQIEQGARQLGLLTGKIVEDEIILSDGRRYPLAHCTSELY